MIELKLEQLRNPEFSKAYGKLMTTTGLEPKTAYHVARVGALLEQELKAANVSHDKLVKEYAEIKNENGQQFWKVPEEKQVAWLEANKNFHDAVVQIEKRKILLSEIYPAKLTPVEFLALEPVLSGLESIDGGSDGKEESH